MAYGTASGVESLLPAIGKLSTSSTPKLAAVNLWLDQGASTIDRALSGAGYTVPVLNTATCYEELTALNELYGAAYAMMARSLDTVQGTDENRSAQWLAMFNERLALLVASTLSDVPLSTATTATTGRRVRFTQLKRVDGYSAPHDDDTDMDS